eukprot:gene5237-3751_t
MLDNRVATTQSTRMCFSIHSLFNDAILIIRLGMFSLGWCFSYVVVVVVVFVVVVVVAFACLFGFFVCFTLPHTSRL